MWEWADKMLLEFLHKFAILFIVILTFNNCYCVDFLDKVVLYYDKEHHEETARVFRSSFLLSNINKDKFFEKDLFEQYITKINSYKEGENLLNRLNILFNACSNLLNQPVQLLVSFRNSVSCFGGRFLSASDHATYSDKLFFSCDDIEKKDVKISPLMMNINLNFIENTLYHDDLGLCTMVQSLSRVIDDDEYGQLCYICDCVDPYWMLLVHEMEHTEHFLIQEIAKSCSELFFKGQGPDFSTVDELFVESQKNDLLKQLNSLFPHVFSEEAGTAVALIDAMRKCRNHYNIENLKIMCDELYKKRRYCDNKDISSHDAVQLLRNKKQLPDPLPSLPEIESRMSPAYSHLWDNLEERETVVGAKNSELVIRLDARLPIRYIYQLKGSWFYESFDTVFQIIKATNRDITSEWLVDYINNAASSKYFDSRKCRHIVNETLLPIKLAESFGYVLQAKPVIMKLPSRVTPKSPSPLLRQKMIISQIISNFKKDNLIGVVSELCNDIGKIKLEILNVLGITASNSIVQEIELHIKNSNGVYDKSIIQKIVEPLILFVNQKTATSIIKASPSLRRGLKTSDSTNQIQGVIKLFDQPEKEAKEVIDILFDAGGRRNLKQCFKEEIDFSKIKKSSITLELALRNGDQIEKDNPALINIINVLRTKLNS